MSWKSYFEFSRSERRGIIFLVAAILVVTIIGRVISARLDKRNQQEIADIVNGIRDQKNIATIDSVVNDLAVSQDGKNKFDSTASKTLEVNAVDPVVSPTNKAVSEAQSTAPTSDINEISAQTLMKVHHLDAQMAYRIVKYRESLGGFYSMKQLSEVFEITPEIWTYMNDHLSLSRSPKLDKLAVNHLSAEELRRHPYISPKLADQMINFRTKVKKFESVEDLKKLYFVDDEIYSKLAPYISIN